MPEFYHNLITEKSFKLLQDLNKKFKFILIGGWAIFLYTKNLKSKDIDIYLPHFFKIGFPVEEIKNYTQKIEGFLLPNPEILLILKIFALKEREDSIKGRKDLIDVFSLLKEDKINWKDYKKIIKKYNLSNINSYLREVVKNTGAIKEIGLLNHKISKLKKSILLKLS